MNLQNQALPWKTIVMMYIILSWLVLFTDLYCSHKSFTVRCVCGNYYIINSLIWINVFYLVAIFSWIVDGCWSIFYLITVFFNCLLFKCYAYNCVWKHPCPSSSNFVVIIQSLRCWFFICWLSWPLAGWRLPHWCALVSASVAGPLFKRLTQPVDLCQSSWQQRIWTRFGL